MNLAHEAIDLASVWFARLSYVLLMVWLQLAMVLRPITEFIADVTGAGL